MKIQKSISNPTVFISVAPMFLLKFIASLESDVWFLSDFACGP